MRLDDALSEFNALRLASAAGERWAARLDRLAQGLRAIGYLYAAFPAAVG